MARNVWVRVHEWRVQEFIQPGGEVYDLVHDVARDARFHARRYIHSRSGKLAAGIQVNRPTRRHQLAIASTVFTRTSYALYVHEGTANNGTGYIYPKNGKVLTVPRSKTSVSGGTLRKMWRGGQMQSTEAKPYFTARRVRGQKSNPFLRKGLRDAMAQLRG